MTKFHEGATCKTCNNTKRYAKGNGCVTCVGARTAITNAARIKRYKTDPVFRAECNAYHAKRTRTRYQNDPAYRERRSVIMKAWNLKQKAPKG